RPRDAVTLVLDTTPPTFGPVEGVLRLVAHTVALTQWATNQQVFAVCLDNAGVLVPIAEPADLVTLWVTRTMEPPAPAVALATAARAEGKTVVLTHHHL
ncbi:hypothetical protein K7G98_38820, partial [Saccharothrix sp. MB29]|nr:hypothetical protein [Saccharothrix sp. MB29]